jgi:hypothetical protein
VLDDIERRVDRLDMKIFSACAAGDAINNAKPADSRRPSTAMSSFVSAPILRAMASCRHSTNARDWSRKHTTRDTPPCDCVN